MKFLVVLSAVMAVALAKPGLLGALPYGIAPYGVAPYGLGYGGIIPNTLGYSAYAAPALAAHAPITYAAAAPAVAVGVHSQYHAQDELGQAAYGHAEPFQTHNAVQDAFGNKIGSYSYLAPDGQVVKTDYVADGAGYRVASNALPIGPTALPVAPLPVADTPEVVAARAAHLVELEAAKHRSRRSIAVGYTPASTALAAPVVAPAIASYGALPYAAHAALPYAALPYAAHAALPYAAHAALPYAAHAALPYAAALPYGAAALPYAAAVPAVRAATLTTVVNNPGHAVSYRVD